MDVLVSIGFKVVNSRLQYFGILLAQAYATNHRGYSENIHKVNGCPEVKASLACGQPWRHNNRLHLHSRLEAEHARIRGRTKTVDFPSALIAEHVDSLKSPTARQRSQRARHREADGY